MIPGITAQEDIEAPLAYIAKAVHFDTLGKTVATDINIPALTATATDFWSSSVWVKGFTLLANLWVVDSQMEAGSYTPSQWFSSGTDIRYWSELTGSNRYEEAFAVPAGGQWNHYLYTTDLNHPSGSRVSCLYINDVLVSRTTPFSDTGVAFSPLFNGLSFDFSDDGTGFTSLDADIADFWMSNESLLGGGTTIPAATRRLFTDQANNPMDPSGFPSALVLFTGDHTQFPINRGTGGTATLIGNPITNATTHP